MRDVSGDQRTGHPTQTLASRSLLVFGLSPLDRHRLAAGTAVRSRPLGIEAIVTAVIALGYGVGWGSGRLV
jgi:hypothetical protein